MFINPKHAIEQGWITGIRNPEKQVQPNAIDFDLAAMYCVKPTSRYFVLDGDRKQHQEFSVAEACPAEQPALGPEWDGIPFYSLEPGKFYDFASSIHVALPAGVTALLIARSTLNRNGVFITSGLYDQGFIGTVAGILHNRSNNFAFISPGSLVGQLMLFRAEDSGILYAGGYNTEVGQHWVDKQ